ncbi:CES2 [Branchiostoma lanceolatum]|uniref:Carboxylic ester hydrolase n=1 Tax=Branchiostoma lanceolatum TaxID=7740 RepID=A0A8J9WGC4_BRALA|nr:CES2 [Branchiostoma lanceolatum]
MATATVSQLLVLAALVFVGLAARPTGPDGPIVNTRYGAVQGMYAEEGAIFLGLPFGVPPVGALRWKPPRAHNASWAPAVRDGTVPGPACRQPGCALEASSGAQRVLGARGPRRYGTGSGVPSAGVRADRHRLAAHLSALNSTARLPVMCWFHGGNYRFGTGGAIIYDGRILANKTNTVVVTTNYRLGAFGFLVTGEGEDDARGNYGTLDQMEALKWVQQNIADFGGDKDKVTIFGQSSGSDSVAVLLTSDRAAHLFHQGIMLSVPFSISHKTQFEAVRFGTDFVKLANCSAGDMKCLRSKSADEVLRAQDEVDSYIANPFHLLQRFMQWGPTVDGDVLPRQTLDSFAKGKFQRKPFIIGTVAEEAVYYIYSAFNKPVSRLELDGAALAFLRTKALPVLNEYNPPQTSDYRPFLSVLVTDWLFNCPTRNAIRSVVTSGQGDVWLYVFDHAFSFKTFWHSSPFCHGHVCHGEDIPFAFQTPLLVNLSFTPDEQVLADSMAYHYGNFAHTGDPNKHSPHVHSTGNFAHTGGPNKPSPHVHSTGNFAHTGDPNRPSPRVHSTGNFAHTGDPNKPSPHVHSTGNGLKPPLNWARYNEGNRFPNMNFTTNQNVMVHDYNKEKCDFWDKEDIYSD